MEPVAFLSLAGVLVKQRDNEAALRTSISRSYYALHNSFSQFIINQGFLLPKTGKRHDLVYKWLHNCGIDGVRDVASMLDDLHDERNDADYDLADNKYQNPDHATMLFIKARTAYRAFEQLSNSKKKRKCIAKGIVNYKAGNRDAS